MFTAASALTHTITEVGSALGQLRTATRKAATSFAVLAETLADAVDPDEGSSVIAGAKTFHSGGFIRPGPSGPMTIRDTSRDPHPAPCPDCHEKHTRGEHITMSALDETGAKRMVWEGCADCWIRRTDPPGAHMLPERECNACSGWFDRAAFRRNADRCDDCVEEYGHDGDPDTFTAKLLKAMTEPLAD